MEGRWVEVEISSTGLAFTSFCFLLSSPKRKNCVHGERMESRLSLVKGITNSNRWKCEVTSAENEGVWAEASPNCCQRLKMVDYFGEQVQNERMN